MKKIPGKRLGIMRTLNWLAFILIVMSICAPYWGIYEFEAARQGLRRSYLFLAGLSLFLLNLWYISPKIAQPCQFLQFFWEEIIHNQFTLCLFFYTVWGVHFSSYVITSTDSKWVIPTAMSIIKEGNSNLDEYKSDLQQEHFYAIETIDGHYYAIFPIGTPLLSTPFVYLLDKICYPLLKSSLWLRPYIRSNVSREEQHSPTLLSTDWLVEEFLASGFIVFTTGFIYFLVRLSLERHYALLLAFIFAFCTPAWSTASRALWQHGPSMLMLTLTLYFVARSRKTPRFIRFASLPLAYAYVIRPTNSIAVLFFTIFIIIFYKKHVLWYLGFSLPVVIPFCLYNYFTYHALLSPYYRPERIVSNPHFFEALLGNLISPARGVLLFTPVLLLSFYGIISKLKNSRCDSVDYLLVSIIICHWLVISSFPHWWAGHAFGPRFFSDMVPFFIYFQIPAVQAISKTESPRKIVLIAIFAMLIALSFAIHYRGANHGETWRWNVTPIDVDVNPARIWDWHDIQFLRGL